MATPIYKGAQQSGAPARSGLGSWFGVGTPAYAGNGQPSSGSGGLFGSGAPAYVTQPSTPSTTQPADACAPTDQITVLIPRELLDPSSVPQQ